MKAGRELDALVAEHLMGWNWGDTGRGLEGLMPPDKHSNFVLTLTFDSSGLWGGMPHYSTNISDAWLVVDEMHEDGYLLSALERSEKNGYYCILTLGNGAWDGRGLTAPLAICRASLQAKGIDIDVK